MPDIVTEETWHEKRLALVAREKELTRLRDEVAAERRRLPWVKVAKDYVFESEEGPVAFTDLVGPHSQLIVQHFMFGADWEEGCPSCSFWADGYGGALAHFAARDTAFVAISRAPIEKLLSYRKRMGWQMDWVSSLGNAFNYDFKVSFSDEQMQSGGGDYNFGLNKFNGPEAPGFSVFVKDGDGAIYRSYSVYSRGLDPMNPVYQYLDLTPKGRDEDELQFPMAWLKRHDQY